MQENHLNTSILDAKEKRIEVIELAPEQDAFGQNIWETYTQKGGGYDIIEREDGCFTLSTDSASFKEGPEAWTKIQQDAAALIKGKGLVVGCGGGKHALELQNRGCEVIGMENSRLAIDVCHQRGLKQSLLCDVANISLSGLSKLDFILLWENNTGLLQNATLANRFLKWAHKATHPKASIFLETLDPHGKAFDFEDDRAYINENIRLGRLPGQIRVRSRYRKYCTPWAEYLFLSKKELKVILKGTGWKIKKTWDDPSVDQYIAQLVK